MADRVLLIIDGREYVGWEEVSISRAMDALAGAFSLSLTDRWSRTLERLPVTPGMTCRVMLGDDLVITGFIDEVSPSIDADSRSLRVSGRDRTGDLVDCSAQVASTELLNQNLGQIARTLAKPYGVSVVVNTAGKPFAVFKLQPGETVFEAIDRACRQRGLLASSDVRGRLVIGTVATGRADGLEEGANLLKGAATFSLAQRFSEYRVDGQQAGTDDLFGESAAAVQGRATDPAVTRHRLLRIQAETSASAESARERACWEAQVRAAKALTVSATVQGWRQTDGTLWAVNTLSRVSSATLRVDDDLLIKGVTFRLSNGGGSVTELELTRRDAFRRLESTTAQVSVLPELRDLTEDL